MAAAKKKTMYIWFYLNDIWKLNKTMGTENNISVLAQAGRSEYTKEHDGILRSDGIVLHIDHGDGYIIVSVKTHSTLHSKS